MRKLFRLLIILVAIIVIGAVSVGILQFVRTEKIWGIIIADVYLLGFVILSALYYKPNLSRIWLMVGIGASTYIWFQGVLIHPWYTLPLLLIIAFIVIVTIGLKKYFREGQRESHHSSYY